MLLLLDGDNCPNQPRAVGGVRQSLDEVFGGFCVLEILNKLEGDIGVCYHTWHMRYFGVGMWEYFYENVHRGSAELAQIPCVSPRLLSFLPLVERDGTAVISLGAIWTDHPGCFSYDMRHVPPSRMRCGTERRGGGGGLRRGFCGRVARDFVGGC